MTTIGKRIKELRTSIELSQKELAENLGVSRGNVGDWESEKSKPGADALLNLSEYFNVTVDWLLSGKEPDARISGQGFNLKPADIELLAKFHQLEDTEQLKIEGMIDGLLLSRELRSQTQSNFKSTHSKTTNEGDHAATSETA